MIVAAQIKVILPKKLHEIFVENCSSELFEADLSHIGCVAVMHFDYLEQYSVMSYLSKAMKKVQLDAFTETLVRKNASILLEELATYVAWFNYGAFRANQMFDRTCRMELISDMNLIISHLSQGQYLSFSKMTSLCDVAGSLAPVRNLILSQTSH